MKNENNFWKNWKTWAIVILVILFLLNYNSTEKLKAEIEYSENCIIDCRSEFEACLDNVTLYNLEQKIQTVPSDPKILSCLWGEDWCVQNCQMRNYDYQKAMGRMG